jgi:hypothetical protein
MRFGDFITEIEDEIIEKYKDEDKETYTDGKSE